jgi:hypothetical protein
MEIPGLGVMTRDDRMEWYYSPPIPVPVLGGKSCRIVVDENQYLADPKKEEFHAAIANFLSIGPSVLKDVESEVFRYYKDCESEASTGLAISSPSGVWSHVQLGSEPMVDRRGYGDRGIYISLECNCDWEPEHGLQIVFRNGLRVNKVGPFDGHLTNSDAFADDRLEHVIYRSIT